MVIKKAYADIAAGQMHFRYVPGDGTPLVFYHRSPANSVCFEPMMAAMSLASLSHSVGIWSQVYGDPCWGANNFAGTLTISSDLGGRRMLTLGF